MSVATILVTFFDLPARAYEDVEVDISGPSAIMIGQTVTFHYKVLAPNGGVLANGSFDFTGSAAGAQQVAGGFNVPVTVTRYPARGGQFDEDINVEIKAFVDVVELISASSSRPFALIGRPVTLIATTVPASYASQVQWWVLLNGTVSGAGAQAEGYASGPGEAQFLAVLNLNGSSSYKPTSFIGVKVEIITTEGGVTKDYVWVKNGEMPATKSLTGNPPGSLQFSPNPQVVNSIIADVGATDLTEYLLTAISPGGLPQLIPGIGPWIGWTSTAKWDFALQLSSFGTEYGSSEITAGGSPLSFAASDAATPLVQVGLFNNLSFTPMQNYYSSSNARIYAEVDGVVGQIGSASSTARSVGGIGWLVNLVDVN